MHHLRFVVIASCLVLSGACKKKQEQPATGSGSAPMGAGSATGSSGSSASGSSAAGTNEAGSAGSAAPGSATAKVEEAKTCSAKAWKQKGGLFCVDAPGFTAGKEEPYLDGDGLQIYFKKEAADGKPELMFNVTWLLKGDPNADAITSAANMENDYKNNKGEDQGAFAGGKGRFVMFSRKDSEKSHKLYTVVQGKKHSYHCEANSYDAPIAPEQLEGCKSVIPTD